MDIEEPLRELGPVDASRLSDAILNQAREAWLAEELRQQTYEVHRDTESMVLVFTESDTWPELVVQKMPSWGLLIETAGPLMHEIIGRHYPPGGAIVRAMAAKLKTGGKIRPHVDSHPSFHIGHRIHVPITTNPRVRFMIDGRPFRLQVGQAYEINNQKTHSVANNGHEDRITFIFDYVPPEQLGRLSQSAA
ncbi:MAG: aspartyl/asparaginyl beta-hydroxylase domain-containing protein [Pseudomonadota bacterium]